MFRLFINNIDTHQIEKWQMAFPSTNSVLCLICVCLRGNLTSSGTKNSGASITVPGKAKVTNIKHSLYWSLGIDEMAFLPGNIHA